MGIMRIMGTMGTMNWAGYCSQHRHSEAAALGENKLSYLGRSPRLTTTGDLPARPSHEGMYVECGTELDARYRTVVRGLSSLQWMVRYVSN